ncbi:MAG: ATP-binding protein, partial [Anaerolineae bacterium]
IITSNRAFEEWAEVFGNDLLASAALDRLTHHTHTLTIQGSSYRQRQRRKTPYILSRGKNSRKSRTSKARPNRAKRQAL